MRYGVIIHWRRRVQDDIAPSPTARLTRSRTATQHASGGGGGGGHASRGSDTAARRGTTFHDDSAVASQHGHTHTHTHTHTRSYAQQAACPYSNYCFRRPIFRLHHFTICAHWQSATVANWLELAHWSISSRSTNSTAFMPFTLSRGTWMSYVRISLQEVRPICFCRQDLPTINESAWFSHYSGIGYTVHPACHWITSLLYTLRIDFCTAIVVLFECT